MIFGHKNDIEKLLPYVGEDLRKALEYLAAADFSKVADGRYVLDGENMPMLKTTLRQTAAPKSRKRTTNI